MCSNVLLTLLKNMVFVSVIVVGKGKNVISQHLHVLMTVMGMVSVQKKLNVNAHQAILVSFARMNIVLITAMVMDNVII